MIDIRAIIQIVEKLLDEGTAQSLTYAALECRLAIEKICYDRLKLAHDYISHADLRGWQPRSVVDTLIAEVDGHTASTFTLSMSREPADSSKTPATAEDFKDVDWVVIGTQAGFDPKKIGSLWHALSNVALHVRLPREKSDPIPAYGDFEEIKTKVSEALDELRRLSKGNLVSSGFGEEVSFRCECGRLNKRRSQLLTHGQVMRCVGPDCSESYEVTIEGEDIYFGRRTIAFDCGCGKKVAIHSRLVEELKRDQVIGIDCDCGRQVRIRWGLVRAPHEAQPS